MKSTFFPKFFPLLFAAMMLVIDIPAIAVEEQTNSWEGTFEGTESTFASVKKVIFNTDKDHKLKVQAWLVGFPEAVPLGETAVDFYENSKSRGQKNVSPNSNRLLADFTSEKVKASLSFSIKNLDQSGKVLNCSCTAFVRNSDGSKVFVEQIQLDRIPDKSSNSQDSQEKSPKSNHSRNPHTWSSSHIVLAVPPGVSIAAGAEEIDFGPYMADLQRRVKRAWFPPRGQESRRVVVVFKIDKQGLLSDLKIVKSAGTKTADQAALDSVQNAAPFKALPANAPATVETHFTFDYNMFSSVRGF